MVNSSPEGPGLAVRAIKKRLHQSLGHSPKTPLSTFTVLETAMKNCGRPLHLLVCTKEFCTDLITRVTSPNPEVGLGGFYKLPF